MKRPTPLLQAQKLSYSFYNPTEVEILKEVTLSLDASESIAIVGPSGSGKSTLLHLLGGLDEPTKGRLLLEGVPFRKRELPRMRNQKIGFIFQSFFLIERATALHNVMLPGLIGRKSSRKIRQRAEELLALVGLTDRIAHPARLLSGGEKQRVALARALCNEPILLLADEPSGNLDQKNSALIHNLLLSLVKEKQIALICVTHDPQLAALCDRSLLLQDGHLCNPV